MTITFHDKDHKYLSADGTAWTSVSTLVHMFVPPFDAESQSIKSSKNRKSKWYGMKPEDIRLAWDTENKRATELGTWFHNKMEQQMYSADHPSGLKIVSPEYREGNKVAGNQRLSDGVYPEHLCHLQSAGICGQSDIVTIQNGTINIEDYKTNKEIRTSGYSHWDTGEQKMLPPLNHLGDCDWIHYALQLSMYAHIIHRHNPQYKVGKLIIHHIQFEHAGHNEYGYPIHKVDENGEPVVTSITPMTMPYLEQEGILMIKHLKNKR